MLDILKDVYHSGGGCYSEIEDNLERIFKTLFCFGESVTFYTGIYVDDDSLQFYYSNYHSYNNTVNGKDLLITNMFPNSIFTSVEKIVVNIEKP